MNLKTETPCIFIYGKQYGRRCNKINCNEHYFKIDLTIQKYLDAFVDDNSAKEYNCPISIDSLFDCFNRLWNRYPNTRNLENTGEVLCYLYDKFMLYRICDELSDKITRSLRKREYATELFNIYWNLWNINNNKRFVEYILPKIQRCIRYGPHIMSKSNNIECPFTLTPLSDLPQNELFSFYENNKIYTFHAPELHYYICKTKSYENPFTRQKIGVKDVNKLLKLMRNIPWKRMENNWSSDVYKSFINDFCEFYDIPKYNDNHILKYDIALHLYEDIISLINIL